MTHRRVPRGFSLLEIMVVVAMIIIASSFGLASLSEIIASARYRADRAKLFLTIKEARDVARDEQRAVTLNVGPGSSVNYIVRSGTGCFDPVVRTVTVPLPMVATGGGSTKCITPVTLPTAPINFSPVGGGPVDQIDVKTDLRFGDSWGEFGLEGALEATGCDIDTNSQCGR